jgi:uncharacterized protein YdiU (UPF0061 family)
VPKARVETGGERALPVHHPPMSATLPAPSPLPRGPLSLFSEPTFAQLPERFFARVTPSAVRAPQLFAWNAPLATQLGIDPELPSSPHGVAILAGNHVPDGALPIALAYAGHQFGNFVPQLGDGRAILLGEALAQDGRRYDVVLKGAGRTPFSRGGDGRAALGPVLREYVVSEAMAALGVPTTRALAAVTTGEPVYRQSALPGAVLTRVAASHLRIGTFQYFAVRKDHEALAQLTQYALERHYPAAPTPEGPALALFDAVQEAQTRLVARWLAVGFVHGVMNTDNMALSGETLDYGPCAFLDTYHPERSFSSIDQNGRYAYGKQPTILRWNLARLAEALLPLVDGGSDRAVGLLNERLAAFPQRFEAAHGAELGKKLGLGTAEDGDSALASTLLSLMASERVDFTLCFRRLCDVAETGEGGPFAALFGANKAIVSWLAAWLTRGEADNLSRPERAAAMRRVNPAFIPRNHRIEEMIASATEGDRGPFDRLLRVLSRPYDDQPDDAELAAPPGAEQWVYQTFCGT